ncbi:MAG: arylsulfotransferase family protein [Pseudomonadota bacterium]
MKTLKFLLGLALPLPVAIPALFLVLAGGVGYGILATKRGLYPVKQVEELVAFVRGTGETHETTLREKVLNDLGVVPLRHLRDRVRVDGIETGPVDAGETRFRDVRSAPRWWRDPDKQFDDLVMIYGVFEFDNGRSGMVLFDPVEGQILRHWAIPADDFVARPEKFGFDPNSGIIIDNAGWKLHAHDFCGSPLWQRDGISSHHSVEFEEGGALWHWEALDMVRRSLTGEELQRFSVWDVIAANPERTAMHVRMNALSWLIEEAPGFSTHSEWTAKDQKGEPVSRYDPFHGNDIQPMPEGFSDRYVGPHVGISYRSLNLVQIVNTETLEIVDELAGRLSRQHDIDFNEDGSITIFDNRNSIGSVQIVEWRPDEGEVKVVYDGASMQQYNIAHGNHTKYRPGSFMMVDFWGRVYAVENGEPVFLFENFFDEVSTLTLYNAWLLPRSNYSNLMAACENSDNG